MSTQNSINQTSVVISNADVEKLAMLKQFMQDNNISPDVLKQVTKTPKEKFEYVDESHEIAICNACGKEFKVADIPQTFIEACQKSGICPDCAQIFAQADSLKANLKSKNITSHGTKIVVNGGKNVGARLKNLFADAIKSPNFTEVILAQFLDSEYSNKNLKFSSYPYCVDITDISEAEIKANSNYYKRFYAKPYDILGRKIRLCSQIFDAQLAACEAEFKKLNLVDADAQY